MAGVKDLFTFRTCLGTHTGRFSGWSIACHGSLRRSSAECSHDDIVWSGNGSLIRWVHGTGGVHQVSVVGDTHTDGFVPGLTQGHRVACYRGQEAFRWPEVP